MELPVMRDALNNFVPGIDADRGGGGAAWQVHGNPAWTGAANAWTHA
jgi:hypothetical protein